MSHEVLYDFSPMLKQFKDGRIERLLGDEFVPPSTDPTTGVRSKDVEILQELKLSVRISIPEKADTSRKIPLLVYFHGGAFLTFSPFHPLYQKHLNLLVAESDVVAVSVYYRLAPEHPVPIAYEDSWLALKWVASQFAETSENCEEWIKNYADSDRVFLGGDSAGANIAHQMAMRVGSENLDGIHLRGIFLNCSFFWGEEPIGDEVEFLKKPNLFYPNDVWRYVCPTSTGCDDPWINPGNDPKLSGLGCKKVLVYVAEKDFFKDRGWYYKEALEKSKCEKSMLVAPPVVVPLTYICMYIYTYICMCVVPPLVVPSASNKSSKWDGKVELVEVKGEGHCFSVTHPDSENGLAMIKKVASFLNY